MQVYVLNHKGKPIMPCSARKARLLLKAEKVKVVKRTPFTIQWVVPTRSFTQPVTLGVDSGYNHVGLSAIAEKKEVYASEVNLRTDIVKLNSARRQYRRARRQRKTWYRKARFLNRKNCKNRKKSEGWLAPSIQHKLDSHLKIINKVKEILPITQINIEVAAFDIQKIKNPQIGGIEYQKGEQKDFWNVREYVLYRDGHTCQHCKGKSKDPVLEVHHTVSRQVGGDRPNNLITLCSICHQRVSIGKLKLNICPSKSKGFKAETFMSTVRWILVNKLRELGNVVNQTYGYITKIGRIELGLPKSHINDAFVIAAGAGVGQQKQKRSAIQYFIWQVRKCNRKLFKGQRSHIRNTVARFIKGFQRFDKVLWKGKLGKGKGVECFIFGRRISGYFDLRMLDGTKIHPSVASKRLTRLESAKTFLIERRNGNSSHPLKRTGLLAVNL